MRRRLRLESRASLWLISCLLFLPSLFFAAELFAANLGDTARQLADRIAFATGPGSIALEVTNRSSLDEKSVREVRSALQAELRAQGVHIVAADQAVGTVNVVLSESLREYVWTAEIAVGPDQPRVVFASAPRSDASLAVAFPITLKKTLLFAQQQPILDAVLMDGSEAARVSGALSSSSRLLVLDASRAAFYHWQSGRWESETSLPIIPPRALPRDLRGRLILSRDHFFDAYLPGTFCRSSTSTPLTITCSSSDDLWPLISSPVTSHSPADEGGSGMIRAFYAPTRNFFTGALSPGIGKISTVPSFYSAAALPRGGYMLWAVAAVDGSVHVIDGITDQAIRGAHWGSDIAAVGSGCGQGLQLLVSGAADASHGAYRDNLRAFEIRDREPVAVSAPLEFDGPITALWSDATGMGATAIVKREDTGWYEANRITVTCAN